MMQMTKKKMVLEHLVVGRLKAQNINQVNNILLETNAFISLVADWNNLNYEWWLNILESKQIL